MKKYFDILESGQSVLWYPGIGLVFFIICLTTVIFFLKRDRLKRYKTLVIVLTVLSFFWTLIIWMSSGAKYYECTDALESKTYSTVTGYVHDFSPMPKEGHKYESFTVEGIKFQYSDFKPSCGFHNSKSHGGPIDEGKYVKINYYKGLIIQLWVKQ